MTILETGIRSMGLSRRLAVGFLLFVLIVAGLGWWVYRLGSEIVLNGPVFERLMVGRDLNADFVPPTLYIVESQLAVADLVATTDPNEREVIINRLFNLKANYSRARLYWKSRRDRLDPEILELVMVEAHTTATTFYDITFDSLIPSVLQNDHVAVAQELKEVRAAFQAHQAVIQKLLLKNIEVEKRAVIWAQARSNQIAIGIAIALPVALLLMLLLGLLLRKSITQPLSVALDIANKIAVGNFDVPVSDPFADEPGRLVTALGVMSQNLQNTMNALTHATRAKSDFLANMSHEIRTPMNAIIGLSGLALKDELNPRVHNYVTKIQQSGQHLLRIINDILDFSKIESGKLEIEKVPFELESVLDTVINLISEKAASKGIEVRCSVDDKVPKVLLGDPLRIGQILINYSNNAVKFTARGEMCIAISIREASESDLLLHFSVRDTGIGMTPEQMGRLFKSFEQADSSTTRQYGGTGLGLAISKSLALGMGGDVGVESVFGQGSTFWFTARVGIATEERVVPRPALNLQASLAPLCGARILLVEDNEINQLVACDLLRGQGFLVDVAENGQAGVSQVHAMDAQVQPYDLVLMDMQMPVMDGVTAARLIRETHTAQRLPVVAMTANAMQSDKERCLGAGMNAVVSKPIHPDELWRALLHWITPRPGLGQPGERLAPAAVVPDSPQQVQRLDALRQVDGLDVDEGIGLSNGNARLYQTMLVRFVKSQALAVQAVRQALRNADRVTAERLAHTLKGLAASLGAQPLRAMAAELEHALRHGADAPVLEPLLLQTQQRLDALVAGLQAVDGLIAEAEVRPAESLTPEQHAEIRAVVARLQALLARDDCEAQTLWEAHAPGLHAVLASAAALERAINAFDFDEALRLLQLPQALPG